MSDERSDEEMEGEKEEEMEGEKEEIEGEKGEDTVPQRNESFLGTETQEETGWRKCVRGY